MATNIMQHTRGKSSGARCPVHHIPIIPVFTPAGRCAQLPSVTSGRSPDQSQAAQWMGAWRDDTFLFRQVSPQLGEHVNKFKINSEPLLADTDTAPCVARRDTRTRPQSCGTSWLSRLLVLVRNIGWGAGKSWKFWQSGGVLTADRAANLKPQWGKTIGLK